MTPFPLVIPVSLSPSPSFSVSWQAGRGLIKNICTVGAEQLGSSHEQLCGNSMYLALMVQCLNTFYWCRGPGFDSWVWSLIFFHADIPWETRFKYGFHSSFWDFICGIWNWGMASSFWNHVIPTVNSKNLCENIYFLQSNTYFWGTVVYLQYGF